MNRTSCDPIEAAVGVADQLQRHGVDPRHAGHLARRELGQLAVVPPRQVVPHAADLGLDQVEVVEQPLGGGGEELAAVHVVGEDAVGVAQHPGVVVEAGGRTGARVVAGRAPG